MAVKKRVLSVRASYEEANIFEQAADIQDTPISTWMRNTLRESAIKEVYGTAGKNDFPATDGEEALFRGVMMILQIVSEGIEVERKESYAERAISQIEKIKAGEWSGKLKSADNTKE